MHEKGHLTTTGYGTRKLSLYVAIYIDGNEMIHNWTEVSLYMKFFVNCVQDGNCKQLTKTLHGLKCSAVWISSTVASLLIS